MLFSPKIVLVSLLKKEKQRNNLSFVVKNWELLHLRKILSTNVLMCTPFRWTASFVVHFIFLSDKIILNLEVKKIQMNNVILLFELKSENEGQCAFSFQLIWVSKLKLKARLSLISTFVSVDLKKFKEIQRNLFYAYLWFMMLWNWFSSLLSFSSSNFWNFRIVNPYFWVWKSLNTTYRAGGHNFSEIFIYKSEIGITFDISTSIRLITTNHGKQVV